MKEGEKSDRENGRGVKEIVGECRKRVRESNVKEKVERREGSESSRRGDIQVIEIVFQNWSSQVM